MKEIGLQPSSTGEPGGKETGEHYEPLHRRRRPLCESLHSSRSQRISVPQAVRTRRSLALRLCLAEHKQLQVMLAELRETA